MVTCNPHVGSMQILLKQLYDTVQHLLYLQLLPKLAESGSEYEFKKSHMGVDRRSDHICPTTAKGYQDVISNEISRGIGFWLDHYFEPGTN